jgi:hypothetical protein
MRIGAVLLTLFVEQFLLADDTVINTPVVASSLRGVWELVPADKTQFKQRLTFGGSVTGSWQRSEKSLPTTLAWFVEGKELRISYYYEPNKPFNYRVKTQTYRYEITGDSLKLTNDEGALVWKRTARLPRHVETRSAGTASERGGDADLLQLVSIPPVDLPEGVRLKERNSTGSKFIHLQNNPDVVSDLKAIEFIARFFGIQGKPELAKVQSVVVAIYRQDDPKNEIGIYGLRCTDPNVASATYEKIEKRSRERGKSEKKFPFVLKGDTLLFVWNNGMAVSVFEGILNHVKDDTSVQSDR